MNNLDNFQSQLQNLQRQYQQLITQSSQTTPVIPLQTPTPQQVPRHIQYVQGIAGARLYQTNMTSNSSEIIMDKEADIFYMVSKDANGTPAEKIVRGHFTVDQVDFEEKPNYLTKKDLDDFRAEIQSLLKQETKAE